MARYTNIPTSTTPNGERIYKTVRYPDIPRDFSDIYVYTTVGDRYDTLALQWYGRTDLWWIISSANGALNQMSLIPPVGEQIRIPANPTPSLAAFEAINENE